MLTRVSKFFADFAPVELGEAWDNVGVLVENPRPNKTAVIGVTIDLTPAVLEEFIGNNNNNNSDSSDAPAEVIIAYHPPIFVGMKKLRLADPKQGIVLNTIAAGASIYSPHTCVDSCRNSINDWLVESAVDGNTSLVVGLWPITPNDAFMEKLSSKNNAEGAVGTDTLSASAASSSVFDTVTVGSGRIASFSPDANISIEQLVANLKKHLGVPTARVSLPFGWEKDKIVTKVAVCAGSGAGLFKELGSKSGPCGRGVEVLISGEMGHHDVLAANDKGQAVILFEHTNSERGYLKHKLVPLLQKHFGSDAKIVLSTRDKDPLVVW